VNVAHEERPSDDHLGLHNLPAPPASHRDRKRIGRGPGSGKGKTSGKGHKGIKARSGHHGPGGNKPRFEGGQMPLTRRLPKRGFTNPFRVANQIVRLGDLNALPADEPVTNDALVSAGLIRAGKGPAKLLANGELTRAVSVRGVRMSGAVREKIVAAGGRVEE
jgi:large subunit ribosomal protein L15